ncbi:MAG: HU family DNA-binding protein, partial [Thiolinea sp.]
MNKSELMRCVAQRLPDIPERDVEQAIKVLFEQLSSTLAAGGRCEI